MRFQQLHIPQSWPYSLPQIEEKLRKKEEEENAKRAVGDIKDPADSKSAKATSSTKDRGSSSSTSVKNKFQNDGNFMAQFRQQMKVRKFIEGSQSNLCLLTWIFTRIMVYNDQLITATLETIDFFEII